MEPEIFRILPAPPCLGEALKRVTLISICKFLENARPGVGIQTIKSEGQISG
jgi:hypothetical protein